MRTSLDRYSDHAGLHKGADGQIRESHCYSYESHNALYDIILIAGLQFVRVNMGPLSNMISDWKPHHYKIADHFNLHEAPNPAIYAK